MRSHNFESSLGRAAAAWAGQCMALAALVGVGLATGQLVALSVAAIVLFVLLNGVLPFRRLTADLWEDSVNNEMDDAHLSAWSADRAEEVLGDQAESTLHRLAILKGTHAQQGASDEIDEALLRIVRERFDDRVRKIGDTAEQAPLLALMGSMVGLAIAFASVGNGGGVAAMSNGLVTMAATSVVGLFGAMILLGLESRGGQAVDKHINSLRVRVSGMAMGPTDVPEEPPVQDSIFRRGATQ